MNTYYAQRSDDGSNFLDDYVHSKCEVIGEIKAIDFKEAANKWVSSLIYNDNIEELVSSLRDKA